MSRLKLLLKPTMSMLMVSIATHCLGQCSTSVPRIQPANSCCQPCQCGVSQSSARIATPTMTCGTRPAATACASSVGYPPPLAVAQVAPGCSTCASSNVIVANNIVAGSCCGGSVPIVGHSAIVQSCPAVASNCPTPADSLVLGAAPTCRVATGAMPGVWSRNGIQYAAPGVVVGPTNMVRLPDGRIVPSSPFSLSGYVIPGSSPVTPPRPNSRPCEAAFLACCENGMSYCVDEYMSCTNHTGEPVMHISCPDEPPGF